jgi:hypothetical protein
MDFIFPLVIHLIELLLDSEEPGLCFNLSFRVGPFMLLIGNFDAGLRRKVPVVVPLFAYRLALRFGWMGWRRTTVDE